jgi:3-oxoacyl-(acyl-carrier-protein) synthase
VAEAGCAVVLERLSSARARDARVYAELSGVALRSGPSQRAAETLGRAVADALASAEARAADIAAVISGAQGRADFDEAERQALDGALGSRARELPVKFLKAHVGETLSAASLLAVCAGALTLSAGRLGGRAEVLAGKRLLITALDPSGNAGAAVLQEVAP